MGLETLQIRLSGGAANVDPTLSYGGAMSTTVVQSQTIASASSIPGVTLSYGAGNTVGSGTLSYVAATKLLSWKAPGESTFGTPVFIGANGTYMIEGSTAVSGYVFVTVVSASLSSVTDYSISVTVTNQTQKIFDDVTKDEAYAGLVDHRCLYIANTGASTAYDIKLSLDSDTPGVDTLTIRGPANAVNTPETSNVAGPGGTYYGASTEITIGNIPAGQYWGFWIKRTVAAATVDGYENNAFRIKLTALV